MKFQRIILNTITIAINKIFKNKIPKRIGHSFTSVF